MSVLNVHWATEWVDSYLGDPAVVSRVSTRARGPGARCASD